MPQHLDRREFIQTSAAVGAVTAAGLLPGAARAASWTAVDAQVHAYERNRSELFVLPPIGIGGTLSE